jgi:hypothetical protein
MEMDMPKREITKIGGALLKFNIFEKSIAPIRKYAATATRKACGKNMKVKKIGGRGASFSFM